jgi:hypothetical protein
MGDNKKLREEMDDAKEVLELVLDTRAEFLQEQLAGPAHDEAPYGGEASGASQDN